MPGRLGQADRLNAGRRMGPTLRHPLPFLLAPTIGPPIGMIPLEVAEPQPTYRQH